MAKMTLGPVIGKVTDTTARILIEADASAQVTCTLLGSGGLPPLQQIKKLTKDRPSVFSFSGLQPDTPYSVTFKGLTDSRLGRAITLASNLVSLDLAVVSCNNTPRRGDTDLWQDLFERYVAPGDVQLLLHLGDQVYGDRAFEGSMRILNGKPKATAEQKREIQELYRQLYRWAWNYPPTRAVLANVPSLMIWDDHDIRDDWGSRSSDKKKGTPEFLIGTLARRVYREYQRQLWDDFNTDADAPVGKGEHHEHSWGSIGILFIDQRGARSFDFDPARPYLGTSQWSEILTSLTSGLLSKVRALIVATSVPLVYLGTGISSVGSAVVNDLQDHWAYGPHQKEQIEMLRALREWKECMPGRELLVVGGDVHLGGETEIRHIGKAIFRQLTTSAITNSAPPFLAYAAIRLLLEQQEDLDASYSFEHMDFTHKRNFGIVMVRIPAGVAEQPLIKGSLVKAV
jgi:hypothetical protein